MTPYEDAALMAGLPYIVNYMTALRELEAYASTGDVPEAFKEVAELLKEHRADMAAPYNKIDDLLNDAVNRLETLGYENG